MAPKGTPEIKPQETVDVFNWAELGIAGSSQKVDLDPHTAGIQGTVSEVKPSHLAEVRRHVDEFNRGMSEGQKNVLTGITPNADDAVTAVDRESHRTSKAYTTVLRGAAEYYTTNHPGADADRKANAISDAYLNRSTSYIKHMWGEREDVLHAQKPDLKRIFTAGQRTEKNFTLAA